MNKSTTTRTAFRWPWLLYVGAAGALVAAAPAIPGLKDVPDLTNESLFSLTVLPKRLGIVGAGPIGCGMAQCFARFGLEVFLVEAEHGMRPHEDRDASASCESSDSQASRFNGPGKSRNRLNASLL